MKRRLSTILLLLAAKALLADCGSPLSSSPPDWVRYDGAIPHSKTGSYVNRYKGSGIDETAARNDAIGKIKHNMEKKYADYRIEREWNGQCSVDNVVVYLLAQTIPYGGKYDDNLDYGIELEVQKLRKEARWFSFGGGSGTIPGLAGMYVSARYGDLWGSYRATWGIGFLGGLGMGNGDLHFSGGVNIYPFNDFYLQYSYGTAIYSRETKSHYENGVFVSKKTVTESGHSMLLGYDIRISFFMLSLGGGVSKTESHKWLPAYNALAGFVFY
jgi:hypothetical protein